MNYRIIYLCACVIAPLVFLGVGCGKSSAPTAPVNSASPANEEAAPVVQPEGEGVEGAEPALNPSGANGAGEREASGAVKMTDDLFVEISAQLSYRGLDEEKDRAEVEKLLDSYGVTLVEYGSYIQALFTGDDRNRAIELGQRSAARLLELQNMKK